MADDPRIAGGGRAVSIAYSSAGVRHRVTGTSCGRSWTACGIWADRLVDKRLLNRFAANTSNARDCKRCFREVTNGG